MQPSPNVLEHYERHFRDGLIDLSISCPQPGTDADGGTRYPEPGGLRTLRAAIARLYPGLDQDHVLVTNGASEALSACALVFGGTGRSIDVATGTYPSFSSLAGRLGSSLRCWDGREEGDVVVVANPTVPDGQLLDMRALAERVHRASRRLIADEVYLDLRPASGIRPAAISSETAISIGDLSKPLGLSGLRIGWAVSQDREAIGRLRRAVQELSGGPSTLAMKAAESAIETYVPRYDAQFSAAQRNGARVFAVLAEAGWCFVPPQQGWTFLARPPRPLSETELETLGAAGFFFVPGSAFGRGGDAFRVSLFAPPEDLRRALAIVGAPRSPGALVVLAKAPEQSKSRLAAQIGVAATRQLAEALLRDSLSLAALSGRRLSVSYAPRSAEPRFADLAPCAALHPQPDGDLGERIAVALGAGSSMGGPAVLIGSDTPHLPVAWLDAAFERLNDHDVVIGPATDGGFYLLGFRGANGCLPRPLFDGVEWSTATVLRTVLANAANLGLSVHQLPGLTDVDDLDSLVAVLSERAPAAAPMTLAAARALGLTS